MVYNDDGAVLRSRSSSRRA